MHGVRRSQLSALERGGVRRYESAGHVLTGREETLDDGGLTNDVASSDVDEVPMTDKRERVSEFGARFEEVDEAVEEGQSGGVVAVP